MTTLTTCAVFTPSKRQIEFVKYVNDLRIRPGVTYPILESMALHKPLSGRTTAISLLAIDNHHIAYYTDTFQNLMAFMQRCNTIGNPVTLSVRCGSFFLNHRFIQEIPVEIEEYPLMKHHLNDKEYMWIVDGVDNVEDRDLDNQRCWIIFKDQNLSKLYHIDTYFQHGEKIETVKI